MCVQARNEGHDLDHEGNEIILEAGKWSPELVAACEVWKNLKITRVQQLLLIAIDITKPKKNLIYFFVWISSMQ